MKSADFLDLLQRQYGVDSDRKLAARLGWPHYRVSKYRTGAREFDEETCADIAERLDLAPAYVMAQIAAERAECTRVREVWQALARMLENVHPGKAALLLVGFFAWAMAAELHHAAQNAAYGLHWILRQIGRRYGFADRRRPLAAPGGAK